MLYPAPQAAPQPQPRRRDSRALAPNTALRPSALQPFLAQNTPRRNSLSLQLQRHLQQQFSGSPVQDPRVTKLARSPSYWSHPHTHSTQSPATVPSHSPRPPIPSFYAGQPDFSEKRKQFMQAHRRTMSTQNFQGNFLHIPDVAGRVTHASASDNDFELLGLPSAGTMGPPLAPGQFSLGSDADSSFSPDAPHGTVSPKDLMFESSLPPSATFTDMSTPSWESPGAYSQDPSPLFATMDIQGQQEWTSLFQDVPAANAFDSAFDLPADLPESDKSAIQPELPASPVPVSPAPRRAAVKASPISATGTTKPSTTAGITRQRKELSPVEFDPNDPVAAKRARNTEAARKSRAKKVARQTVAESRIRELEEQLAQRDELINNLQAQLRVHQGLQ